MVLGGSILVLVAWAFCRTVPITAKSIVDVIRPLERWVISRCMIWNQGLPGNYISTRNYAEREAIGKALAKVSQAFSEVLILPSVRGVMVSHRRLVDGGPDGVRATRVAGPKSPDLVMVRCLGT